jgi:PAS domain S-box-containing protein
MILTINGHLTELRLAEKTLTEQQHLLRTILDATPDYVSLQDRDLIYRAANQAFCGILDLKEEQIIGRSNLDLFIREQAELYQREDLEVLESGRTLIKDNVLKKKGGDRWLHVMKIPVRDARGRITGLLGNCRDISELKKMQEQLTQAQKMETVGQLTAGIAHEINTPLGIILGYAQLLLEDVKPGNQIHQDLATIVKQTKICRKIVADLLNFSRHTESTSSLVDLNRSFQEVIAVVEHTFNLDRVAIATDLLADLPLLKCDVEKLKQVFVNLLNNAHDAIGTDGTIYIKTEYAADDNEVVIYVADTGTGIPTDKIDRIFDPFYTTKPVDKGTGLGLSVTFGIVKEHGGKIDVESPPVSFSADDGPLENGTLFIIHLPAGETNRVIN